MKRNRIGNTEVSTTNYWSGGKDTHKLRQSEILLYSYIDLLQEEANILEADNEIQAKYNQMDMYFATLKIIEAYGSKKDLLINAGVVLGNMIEAGDFAKTYDSLTARNVAVDALIGDIFDRTTNFTEVETQAGFDEWFRESVVSKNFYCNPVSGEQSEIEPFRSAEIGVTYDYSYYSSQAKESGAYWLYAVVDRDDYTDEAYVKRLRHIEYLNWFESCNTGLTRESIKANAKAGIIAKTGKTPETNLNEFISQSKPSVGFPFALIVAAIAALATLVTAVVAVVNVLKGKDAPTDAQVQTNAASGQDWLSYYTGNSSGSSSTTSTASDMITDAVSSPILWIGVGLLALAYFVE